MDFSNILLQRISHHLLRRGETISIFENCTSGFLQIAFSQMPESETFFKGGLTLYGKSKMKGFDDIDTDLESERSSCEKVSLSIGEKFGSDWAIALSGYAAPCQDSGDRVYTYYSISYKNVIIRSDIIELHPMTKPVDAQKYFAEYILTCLRCELKHHNQYIAQSTIA